MKMAKGIMVFYSNVTPQHENELVNATKFIEVVKDTNKEQIKKFYDVGYDVVYAPCVGESTRFKPVVFGETKGCLIFWVNVNVKRDEEKTIHESEWINSPRLVNIIKEENKDQFRRCSEAGYEVLCIPCVGEGSRVEKVNFAGSGCLVIYSNVDVDYESEWTSSSKYIEVIQQYNKDQIAKCKEYGVDVMVIPCTGEGSRKEYIIFEDMEKEENND